MHATVADPAAPPHAHRRPQSAGSTVWRVIRTILAVLGALFILFIILGVTLGGSKPAANIRPLPEVTVTRTVPGPVVTVTSPRPPVRVTVKPTVITINVPPD